MNQRLRNNVLCGAALWLWAGAIMVGVTGLSAEEPKLPDGPGKATTVRVCGECHGAEMVAGRRESRDGWNAVVDDMVQRGAKGTDDEFNEVVDYLAKNFPKDAEGNKIRVNTATAKELAGALGISEKQSAAIVHYREEKGKFKSFEELAKVPGVDAAKIEPKKNRLTF